MRILIIGGHLTPALCLIENLKNEEIFFVGRKYAMEGDRTLSLEHQTITSLNIPFYEISTSRIQRKFTRYTLTSFLKFPQGFLQAVSILNKIKPDVVVGFGGYVSVPIIISAYFLKIPCVIHEQTFEAGFANKILSPFATKICVSWGSSLKFFPKQKTVLTGLPIKKEITQAKRFPRKERGFSFLYITGGSLGSHKINKLVEEILPKLLENFYVFHQTGKSAFRDFERLTQLKNSLNKNLSKNYQVTKFLRLGEITQVLADADIVLSRSGVNTVAELLYLEKPALLIPIHFSQRNEQLKNALLLKNIGLAEIEDERTITSNELLEKLLYMQKNISLYKIKSQKKLFSSDASLNIIKILKDVSKEKNT